MTSRASLGGQLLEGTPRNWLPPLLGLIVIAPILGLIASLGNLLIAGFVIVIPLTLILVASPTVLVWMSVIGGLVIAGVLELYLPELKVLRWAVAGFAILLPVSVLLQNFSPKQVQAKEGMPALFYWAMAFVMLSLLTSVLNWRGVAQAVFGWKSYFQLWGLFLGLVFLRFSPVLFHYLPKVIFAIALIQIPFALHEFIFLVPKRLGLQGDIVPVDIVAGTFGASMTGGGGNAALAMFLIFVAAVLISIWKTGALGWKWVFALLPVVLAPIFLNESKISVFYLVLSYLVVFWREIASRPLRFMAMSGLVAVTAVGLVFSYVALHETSPETAPDLLANALIQNTGEGERYGGYQLNRATSIKFWAEERHRYDLIHALIGHGLGESHEEKTTLNLTQTMAVKNYPGMGIGLLAVTSLLWDTGVIGLIIVVGMFISAFRLAGRLARRSVLIPYQSGLFLGIQAGTAIIALSLVHKNFFVYHLEYQVFVMLVLGYLVYSARNFPSLSARQQAGHTKFQYINTPS